MQITIDSTVATANGTANAKFIEALGTKNLFYWDGAYQSITGTETSGFDSIIRINPNYLTGFFDPRFHITYYVDPDPTTSSDVLSNYHDTLGTFIHEMLHGIGFNGFTDWSTITNTSTAESPFDLHIVNINGQPYFRGTNANAVYGGDVPLTSGNLFHVGNSSGAGSQLSTDLMNGFVALNGPRRTISDLDLAILADLGFGTTRSDVLAGPNIADNMAGGAGNDTMTGGVGNDVIDGGTGVDIAVFSGSRAQYTITNSSGVITVADATASRDGTDTLRNTEQVKFTDYTLVFDLSSSQDLLVYKLYQAAYARTPDNSGFRFWAASADANGTSALHLADSFLAAPEFTQRYGANPSNTAYATAMYTNVLGRAPDSAGLNFWVNALNNGEARDQLLVDFALSGENATLIASHVSNGYWTV